jgi:hypothetical protein
MDKFNTYGSFKEKGTNNFIDMKNISDFSKVDYYPQGSINISRGIERERPISYVFISARDPAPSRSKIPFGEFVIKHKFESPEQNMVDIAKF